MKNNALRCAGDDAADGLCRARESSGRGAIRDRKAEEIGDRLDYDFSLAERDFGHAQRRHCPDHCAGSADGSMACENPGAVVVNIACGLDTRCYRMVRTGDIENVG